MTSRSRQAAYSMNSKKGPRQTQGKRVNVWEYLAYLWILDSVMFNTFHLLKGRRYENVY